jgi:NAD(P)-dependent dehydrogenase (short-subunit alcohol dehydrogenase family)
VGRILVDGLGVGDVGNIVLRDRQNLAQNGIMIVVLTLDRQRKMVVAGPNIVSRGVVYVRESENLMEEAQQVVDAAHKEMGRIDLMVCNAANGGVRGSILTITPEYLNSVYALNYRNYILCSAAAARYMVADKIPGNIIFITSTHGDRAYPDDFLYGSLKAGIQRAAESMACDLGSYGIKVNCIAPGCIWPIPEGVPQPPFATECIPLQRVGTAKEIGELVAFLASDAGSYITGMTIKQDGGLILPGMYEWSRDQQPRWLSEKWHQREYETAMKMMQKDDPKEE